MIDRGLPSVWPPEVLAACKNFEQGQLLESVPFAAYWAVPRHQVWHDPNGGEPAEEEEEKEEQEDGGLAVFTAKQPPPFAVITSQSCDIDEFKPVHAWIQVAPIYRLDSPPEDWAGHLKRQYLVRLTADQFKDELWVADLRIDWPVEKSVLVGRSPITGFASEGDVIAFAARLGRRRDRAVLSNELAEVIDTSLRKQNANKKNASARVYQNSRVALAIEQGTRRRPLAAALYIITDGKISKNDEDYFQKWWDGARTDAATHGIKLLPNVFLDGNNISVYTYDNLILLDPTS